MSNELGKNVNSFLIETNSYDGLMAARFIAKNTFVNNITVVLNNVNEAIGSNHKEEMDILFLRDFFRYDLSYANVLNYEVGYLEYPECDKMHAYVTYNYINNRTEINELMCYAFEIASILKNRIKKSDTFFDVIMKYQSFLAKYFKYGDPKIVEDHSPFSLLKTRKGVCQAVSALSLLILNYMGFETIYCQGDFEYENNVTCHAWNMIKTPKGWKHFDFTSGLRGNEPLNTYRKEDVDFFNETYRFSDTVYSVNNIEVLFGAQKRIFSKPLKFIFNCRSFNFNNVKVSSNEPMVKKNEAGEGLINLYSLISFYGGGYKYVKEKNLLRVVLFNKEYEIKKVNRYVVEKEYMDISVLNELPIKYSFNEEGLELVRD